jgi:hypothetical protein
MGPSWACAVDTLWYGSCVSVCCLFLVVWVHCGGQVLGLVFTFGSGQPGVQAMVLTLLCVAYGMVHTAVAPLRNPAVGPLTHWSL